MTRWKGDRGARFRRRATGRGRAALAVLAALAGVTIGGTPARAQVVGTLVNCQGEYRPGTSMKVVPGLSLSPLRKNGMSADLVFTCTADEAKLDEIARGSRFGVRKTAADGRPATTAATGKLKLTTFGDCTFDVGASPGNFYAYPYVFGTLDLAFDSGLKSTLFLSSIDFAIVGGDQQAYLAGYATRGLGVVAFAWLSLIDGPVWDFNGNGLADTFDCITSRDPSARIVSLLVEHLDVRIEVPSF